VTFKVILHQFWVKKISPWKFNLEYGGTSTKLFMHVSSWNMFPPTRNLQIRDKKYDRYSVNEILVHVCIAHGTINWLVCIIQIHYNSFTFMHVSSWNMFPPTRNLQIRVHVYRPRHCCGDWLTFGCFCLIVDHDLMKKR
jgi:hypothetical protein